MIHTTLTPERWSRFSLMEQLANVGCDIERAITWKNRNEADYSQGALARALELLDLTIADPKNEKQLKELFLVREALLDYFVGNNEIKSTDESWHEYFFAFNWAAALERQR